MIKYIISGTILEQGSTTISPTTFDIVKNNSEKPMSSPLQIKCTSDDLRRKYVMYDRNITMVRLYVNEITLMLIPNVI